MNPVEQISNLSSTSAAGSPMRFQLLALVVIALLLLLTIAAAIFKKATRGEAIFWSIVWVCAGAGVFRPDLSMTIARKLGIGRGADLLLYCAVGVMLVGFMMVYVRLRRLRREITLIVRHLALKDPQSGSGDPKTAN